MRHPEVLALMDGFNPVLEVATSWDGGRSPMRVSCYVGAPPLPEPFVISVRVLVLVDDRVVVCTNVDGESHVWPGGRREAGETYVETACREVLEETGWVLDPRSARPLGWIHLHQTGDPLPGMPHPDALQLVLVARAVSRQAEEWTDVEGREVCSTLLTVEEALDPASNVARLCLPYLRAVSRMQPG